MGISASALRYFVALAEEQHFARTAERLHITPPSLSQQIARLEKSVGRALFERSPRGVRLTAAGEELLPLAREAVDAHREVEDWARAQPVVVPPLRVGIVASGAGNLTAAMLTTVVERHPALRLRLVRLGFFDTAAAIDGDTVDVALTLSPFPENPGIVATTLMQEARVLVLRADHPLAARKSVRIDETNHLPFVVPNSAPTEARAWWLVDPRPDGTSPRVSAVADDVEGLMDLCSAGLGVNIATASVATHFGRPELAYLELTDVAPAEII
ncbi:MAG: hcaR 2, partial [Microbacterium sp.]|nr:hcaR 2 [Microbacterium sp.]